MRKLIWTTLGLSFTLGLAACAATPRGATSAELRTARNKAPIGAEVYRRKCSSCHGERGEGRGEIPEIIGFGALPEYPRIEELGMSPASATRMSYQDAPRSTGTTPRGAFKTAQDLFNYVKEHVPESQSQLEEAEYWALTNFILDAHGSPVPEEGVTPQNARSIPIED